MLLLGEYGFTFLQALASTPDFGSGKGINSCVQGFRNCQTMELAIGASADGENQRLAFF